MSLAVSPHKIVNKLFSFPDDSSFEIFGTSLKHFISMNAFLIKLCFSKIELILWRSFIDRFTKGYLTSCIPSNVLTTKSSDFDEFILP